VKAGAAHYRPRNDLALATRCRLQEHRASGSSNILCRITMLSAIGDEDFLSADAVAAVRREPGALASWRGVSHHSRAELFRSASTQRRSSKASSLCGRNSAGFPGI